MRLSDQIRALHLPPAMSRTLADALREVAAADGVVDDREIRCIDALVGVNPDPALAAEPLESLWPHAEILIRACVEVSLADGDYAVEEARCVSALAHRLGVSVHRLAEIEEAAFKEFRSGRAR